MTMQQLLRVALFAVAIAGYGQVAVYAQEAEEAPAMEEASPADAPVVDMPMAEGPMGEAPMGQAPPAGNAPGANAAKLGEDPAVSALLDSRPSTPVELFRIA